MVIGTGFLVSALLGGGATSAAIRTGLAVTGAVDFISGIKDPVGILIDDEIETVIDASIDQVKTSLISNIALSKITTVEDIMNLTKVYLMEDKSAIREGARAVRLGQFYSEAIVRQAENYIRTLASQDVETEDDEPTYRAFQATGDAFDLAKDFSIINKGYEATKEVIVDATETIGFAIDEWDQRVREDIAALTSFPDYADIRKAYKSIGPAISNYIDDAFLQPIEDAFDAFNEYGARIDEEFHAIPGDIAEGLSAAGRYIEQIPGDLLDSITDPFEDTWDNLKKYHELRRLGRV